MLVIPSFPLRSPCPECPLRDRDKSLCRPTCQAAEDYAAYVEGRRPIDLELQEAVNQREMDVLIKDGAAHKNVYTGPPGKFQYDYVCAVCKVRFSSDLGDRATCGKPKCTREWSRLTNLQRKKGRRYVRKNETSQPEARW